MRDRDPSETWGQSGDCAVARCSSAGTSRKSPPVIKVVDIFAGPGGLSEGFAAVTDIKGSPTFDITLSIEKDQQAHETLQLRTFFRQFMGHAPGDYYRLLDGTIERDELFKAYPSEAKRATTRSWHATLGAGGEDRGTVRKRINDALGGDTDWVLIGGPPCQAYSLAGRSRNRGNPNYDPDRKSVV